MVACREYTLNNEKFSRIRCCPDYGDKTCDIPINSVMLGTHQNKIDFLATVFIPKGFTVIDRGYHTCLTIGKQDLSETEMTQICRCCCCDECTTLVNCVLLNGMLNYNVTMEHFRPYCPLESDNLTKESAFCGYGNIYVDKILLCSKDKTTCIPEYSIIPVQGEEFITCNNGQNIYRMQNKRDFITLLKNPNIDKVIHIPYKLCFVMK